MPGSGRLPPRLYAGEVNWQPATRCANYSAATPLTRGCRAGQLAAGGTA